MREKIQSLKKKNIFIGTSSWKYEGWKGIVYNDSYRTTKDFNERALAEYAKHYTTVGVDHTFYHWPTEKGFQKYVEQTPDGFRFGLKVTEKITIFQYPQLPRYGKEAGSRNSDFLNVELFQQHFLAPLLPFRDRLGPIMLEFSQFYPGTISRGSEFVEKLDTFFSALSVKNSGLQIAVEIRNQQWLKPPYFEMLKRHGVGHVFNSWTRMPSIDEQLKFSEEVPLDFYASRILLKPGTRYEKAVEAFSPYDRIRDEQPGLRAEAAHVVERALALGAPAYLFVNNRAEGCAPITIDGILDLLPI
jgi:uncharacterized protein YecE (DUF72 family)